MKIVYGGKKATHRRQCSGSNWTNNRRCLKTVAFRKETGLGEVKNDFVGLDVKVYCKTHRYQMTTEDMKNAHVDEAER